MSRERAPEARHNPENPMREHGACRAKKKMELRRSGTIFFRPRAYRKRRYVQTVSRFGLRADCLAIWSRSLRRDALSRAGLCRLSEARRVFRTHCPRAHARGFLVLCRLSEAPAARERREKGARLRAADDAETLPRLASLPCIGNADTRRTSLSALRSRAGLTLPPPCSGAGHVA